MLVKQTLFLFLFRNEAIFVVQWSHISKHQHDGNSLRKLDDVYVGTIFSNTSVADMDPSYQYGGKNDKKILGIVISSI